MICGATYVRYVHDARASVSMPHAALWVVQQGFVPILISRDHSFNAARGFVGGAASIVEPRKERKFVSMPHAALWVVQQQCLRILLFHRKVSMPHAALWVVQHQLCVIQTLNIQCFNAARGFVGGAATESPPTADLLTQFVSMPHAALWVVQLRRSQLLSP